MTEQYQKALLQCEAIRRSGVTNMIEKNTVQLYANEIGAHALVVQIDEGNMEDYMSMIKEAPQQEYSSEQEAEIETLAYDARDATVTVEL